MKMPLLDHRPILLFDLETTGFSPQKDAIIEVGILLLDATLSPNKKHSFFVKTNRHIPPKITELTGITQRMSDSGEPAKAAFELFRMYNTDQALWGAYNIQFDIGFVQALFDRFEPGLKVHANLIDVMAIYKDRFKAPHALKHAIDTLGVLLPNTHRAIDDVLATAEVLKRLHAKQSVDPFVNAIGYHPKYGLKGPTYSHITYLPNDDQIGRFESHIQHLEGGAHAKE